MKTFKHSLLALSFALLLSCNNNTKRDVADDVNGTDISEEVFEDTDMNRDKSSTTEILSPNSTDLETNENMGTMYRDLNMTPDQIDRFEKDYKARVANLKEDKELNDDKTEEQMDQSLRKVLSEDEYDNYLRWKQEH